MKHFRVVEGCYPWVVDVMDQLCFVAPFSQLLVGYIAIVIIGVLIVIETGFVLLLVPGFGEVVGGGMTTGFPLYLTRYLFSRSGVSGGCWEFLQSRYWISFLRSTKQSRHYWETKTRGRNTLPLNFRRVSFCRKSWLWGWRSTTIGPTPKSLSILVLLITYSKIFPLKSLLIPRYSLSSLLSGATIGREDGEKRRRPCLIYPGISFIM